MVSRVAMLGGQSTPVAVPKMMKPGFSPAGPGKGHCRGPIHCPALRPPDSSPGRGSAAHSANMPSGDEHPAPSFGL